MSLIIDALKKAQQLRMNGFEGSPILKYPHQDKRKGRGSKKQWSLIGAGLVCLCILLFVLLRPSSPPLATQSHPAIVPIERISSIPVAEKISPEPSEKDEEPPPTTQTLNRIESGKALNHDGSGKAPYHRGLGQAPYHKGSGQAGAETPPYTGVALSNHLPQLEEGKASSKIKPSLDKKSEKTLAKQVSPPSLATQKEEIFSKSIGVEKEGGKDSTLTSDVLIHFNSGVSFYNQKEFSKAIQAYQKVIELDPTYVEAYNNLGILYQMIGDVERAFETYKKSTEINPKYEKGYNNLGILLLLKGRNEEALEAFQKALAINPNNIESHINLGILLKKKGEWEKAIASYRRALAVNPLHGETHYNIALLYEHLESSELAISHYQQFIQLSFKSHPELVTKVQRHLNALIKVREGK